MANREIQIPFGPDKTGGLDPVLSPAGEGSVSSDPLAEPSANVYENDDRTAEEPAVAASRDYHAGGVSDDEAAAQGLDDVQMSFLALKDSIGQGRELKAREKERSEFAEKLEADREELADREDILANYQARIAEQDDLIAERTQQRDARKAELSQVVTTLDETDDALARMREYHSSEMQPLETELGRARANADQAKNDERSRKSELNAVESELRRAESGDDTTMATAKHQQIQAAYDEAKARSEQAKDTLAEVQRIYDDAKEQAAQAEAPLARSLEDLKHRESELKESINRLGDEISAARKRRSYCDTVYQNPGETAKLRESVTADEGTMRQMDAETDELRDRLAQSKAQSKKAKMAIGIVVAIVVVFFAALAFILLRGA